MRRCKSSCRRCELVERNRRLGNSRSHGTWHAARIRTRCVSYFNAAIENAPIERVFLSVLASHRVGRRKVPIHIFPTRFGEAGLARLAPLRAHDEDRDQLWTELQALYEAYEAFEADHRVPRVRIEPRTGDDTVVRADVATSSSSATRPPL